ncbi:MAG: FHA domain-containing protein [Leptolyngbya sp. SIO4C1]|nr:FHA domain-containing protein [Leptolyngbya sp. SIO4C1]
MKLYDQNRALLDEILSMERTLPNQRVGEMAARYVQGVVTSSQTYLVSNLATGRSQPFLAEDRTWSLGRDPRQSDLVIPDKRLSRCHAAIQYGKKGFIISDLESTNGTYVNGKLVKRVCPLKDGDRIRLGSLTFHFYAFDPSPNASLAPSGLDLAKSQLADLADAADTPAVSPS